MTDTTIFPFGAEANPWLARTREVRYCGKKVRAGDLVRIRIGTLETPEFQEVYWGFGGEPVVDSWNECEIPLAHDHLLILAHRRGGAE